MCNTKSINNRIIGQIGEVLGSKFLKSKGYTVVARNILLRVGEIDILAIKNQTLFIFEVKSTICYSCNTNISGDLDMYGPGFDQGYFPEERIDRKKQRKLNLLAKYVDYLCTGQVSRIFDYSRRYKLCEHVGECSCKAGYLGTLSGTSVVTQETSQNFKYSGVSVVGLIVYINRIGVSNYVAKSIIEVPINCY